ncbi:hypothetical protein CR513_14090, partial [Mucuna pruriens]
MPPDRRQNLVELLIGYVDVFAWSYYDMLGLDTTIVEHRLPLIPNQLKRRKPEVALKIKEEVEKQWNAGFLVVVEYPQWVANIEPIPKKDGKRSQQGKSQGQFPLPHINMLVDNIAQHAFYSFMDDFFGYNQIWVAVEDKEKTICITTWGTFYYKVMPFRLKNAEATYQRAMVTLFHDMMHKEVEVYMDDMIAKSRTPDQHLNPVKCTFGIKIGKLLDFIVNQRGIEVNLDKVKAIRNIPPPKTETEVRGFLGGVSYIAMFISQLISTCSPIFKLFQKNQKMEWNDECQEAFEKVKQFLEALPILVADDTDKSYFIYLIGT